MMEFHKENSKAGTRLELAELAPLDPNSFQIQFNRNEDMDTNPRTSK